MEIKTTKQIYSERLVEIIPDVKWGRVEDIKNRIIGLGVQGKSLMDLYNELSEVSNER